MTALEMDFDSLVSRLELSLLPMARTEEARLRTSALFSEPETVSLRHADAFHAMGITCRPIWSTDELERLSLTTVLTELNGLSGRIDIQWSQAFSTRTHSGYRKNETCGFHSKLTSEFAIARFEKEWRRMLALFSRITNQGKPSPYWLRRLRGAPADVYGCNREAN